MSFYQELRRRNVFRVAIAYVAGSWLLIQVADTLFPVFALDAAIRLLVILLGVGFVPAVALAWAFQITPEGIRRDRDAGISDDGEERGAQNFDRAIVAVLALALGYFTFDKFLLDPARDAEREQAVATAARSEALVERYGDKSIAVLPFTNLSADPDQEYFSDGIAEELLNLLTNIPDLRVISRSSSFAFKGKDIRLEEIAEKLNVAHVLEGSVRRQGKRARVSVQLTDARTATRLWAQTYDRTLEDIFATQDEIAARVAEELQLELLGRAEPKAQVTDPEAWSLFLQARHLRLEGTPEAWERALDLYQTVLSIDPDYAAAWLGLAETYVYQVGSGLRPADEGFGLARSAVNRALAIDPDSAVAISGFAWIAWLHDRDMTAAARYLERAVALDPVEPDVIQAVGYFAESIGHMETAIAYHEFAVARDPLGEVGHFQLGRTYLKAGRAADAEAALRIALNLRPNAIAAWRLLGLALVRQGKIAEALEAMEQESYEEVRLAGLSIIYDAAGERQESERYLDELIEKFGDAAAFQIANVHGWRNEPDATFEWLEKARALNDPYIASIVSYYGFESLHDDPRWQPFLAQIGLSDEQLAAINFKVPLPGE